MMIFVVRDSKEEAGAVTLSFALESGGEVTNLEISRTDESEYAIDGEAIPVSSLSPTQPLRLTKLTNTAGGISHGRRHAADV